jgi:periplasmic protein TonB
VTVMGDPALPSVPALFGRMPAGPAMTSALLHAAIIAAFIPLLVQPRYPAAPERVLEFTVDLPAPAVQEPAPVPPPEAFPRVPRVTLDSAEAPTLITPPRRDETIDSAAARMSAEIRPLTRDDTARRTVATDPVRSESEKKEQDPVAAPLAVAIDRSPDRAIPVLPEPPPISPRDFLISEQASAPKGAPSQKRDVQAPTPATPVQQAAARRPSQQRASDGADGLSRPAPLRPADRAEEFGARRAQQDYLVQVVRHLSRYRFLSPEERQQGVVVTRLTVARDGSLVDASLVRSSGFPSLDRSVMETVRKASPFAPLPSDIRDDRFTFLLPINYVYER